MTDPDSSIELEMKIAFLERTVDTLNEVLVDQGRTIESLELKLARLEARVSASQDAGEEGVRDLADDKPPHY